MGTSKIEWTESTWNPVTGCTKVSAGCAHCYAERMARRLRAMGQPNYRNGFKLTCHEHVLEQPLNWKTPRTIFVNSMSDLFHEDVPDAFIASVFSVMERASWHQFQVLTKRDERLIEFAAATVAGQSLDGRVGRERAGKAPDNVLASRSSGRSLPLDRAASLNRWAASVWPEFTGSSSAENRARGPGP